MKTRVSLKYFVSYILWKKNFFLFLLAIDPFKLNFFDIFDNSKAFHIVLTQN